MAQHVLGRRTLDLLNRTHEIREILEHCKDGGLTKEVQRFVRSLEGRLRGQLDLDQWTCEVKVEDDSSISLNLFPEGWRLPDGEFVAFGVYWCNPFDDEAEDPCVFLRVPPADVFPARDRLLKQVKPALIAKGFEEYFRGVPDPYYPVWRYIALDSFASPSGFDLDAFVVHIVETFANLLPCARTIDQVFQALPPKPAPPPPVQRPLKIVAVVDTETAGMGATVKMTELAVVVVAYDEFGDQIVGVLEEYNFKIPRKLDGIKTKALLDQADFVVAHNKEFDQGVLARELPEIGKLPTWLCSWRDIDWKRLAGVQSESLEALLGFEGLACAQEHTALADARDLLRLLASRRNGRTYLAWLLGGARTKRIAASK
jgi:hypothetical protein